MRRLLCALMLFVAVSCGTVQEHGVNEARVQAAVERMLADYPQSTLQDIYKSFFQDRFGPGHIVADTAQAAAYLRRELAVAGDTAMLLYEPTGDHGNYVRVALAVVSNGKVPLDKYLSCFLRSVSEVSSVEVEQWVAEWAGIKRVIDGMSLNLPNYAEEAAAIEEMLSTGHYAVHHSKRYNNHYAPHYRIMAKDIFEAEILPLITE